MLTIYLHQESCTLSNRTVYKKYHTLRDPWIYADLSDKRNKQVEGTDICLRPVRANNSQLKIKWGVETLNKLNRLFK